MFNDLFISAYNDKPIYIKNDHILIRCPYCGDSVKNYQHAHLYIEPNKKVFWCARCYIGGTLKYLLYTIKDKINPYYFDLLLSEVKNNKDDYYNINKQYNNQIFDLNIVNNSLELLRSKYLTKTNKEIELIQNFFLYKFNLYLTEYQITRLPVFIGNKINMQNYLCYFTLSNLVICRHMINHRKFRNYYLNKNNTENKDNTQYINRCTIFSFNKYRLNKFNKLRSKLNIVIAEGLTDLLHYYNNEHISDNDNYIFISTNGKYKDDLEYILNIYDKQFDNFIFLIDNDALHYEVNYIKSLNLKNTKIIIPINNNDYRSSSIYSEVTV